MKTLQGYHLIQPDDLTWRESNLMRIPNADFLERTGTENLAARLWRYPPKSAGTLHKHIRPEEFYFVLEGTGRIRVGDETLTVPRHGGLLVGPDQLRQIFNDTETDVLWLVVGAPEETEFLPGAKAKPYVTHLSRRSEAIAKRTEWHGMAAKKLNALRSVQTSNLPWRESSNVLPIMAPIIILTPATAIPCLVSQ